MGYLGRYFVGTAPVYVVIDSQAQSIVIDPRVPSEWSVERWYSMQEYYIPILYSLDERHHVSPLPTLLGALLRDPILFTEPFFDMVYGFLECYRLRIRAFWQSGDAQHSANSVKPQDRGLD